DAALQLRTEHRLESADIAAIELSAFHEATRLYRDIPDTTAVAQYAIAFPVAAALVHGRLGVAEITGDGLADAEARRMVAATTIRESPESSARFPTGRWGAVVLVLRDGRRLASGPRDARGGPENPLREDEIIAKFHDYAAPAIGTARARSLADAVRRLA